MTKLKTIGIIGEGKMGTNLVHYLLSYPLSIRWIVSQEADSGKIRRMVEKKRRRLVQMETTNEEDGTGILHSTLISNNLSDATECDLILETIPEDITRKQQLFKELDQIIDPSCILASNSSSINPSRLYPSRERRDKVVGLHFFYPVQLKKFVEFIVSEETSNATAEGILEFLNIIGKQPLLQSEKNSFILNKMFLDIQNEAYNITESQQISFRMMDQLVKDHLFPVGIFDVMDQIGLDTMLVSIKNYVADYPHQDYYLPLVSRLASMVRDGHLGIKSGKGFYDYPRKELSDTPSDKTCSEEERREITEHLRFTYLIAAKRSTIISGCTIGEMNDAIKEYLGTDKGPFE